MDKSELLGSLRALELRLSTSEVNGLMRTQPVEVQNEFAHWTLQISIAISRVERADLTKIGQDLQAQAGALRTGIVTLQQNLVSLQHARSIVDTLSTVVTTVVSLLALL